ncbi:MAG: UDP-N-acetylmuramate--L-alanine ligase [Planctomycetaceae bacterium]
MPGSPINTNPATRSALLLGVCGAGMRSLAELLSDEGWQLWGTDNLVTPADSAWLQSRSISGLRREEIQGLARPGMEVIFSPSVPEEEPHRVAAREAGLTERSLPQFLGQLMRGRRTVCVAGTHGKSTTTALVGWIMQQAGLQPAVFLGAQLQGGGRSGWSGGGDLLVAESCEYRGHFLDYSPQWACLLSVEPDHFDCFPDRESGLRAFSQFAALVPPSGRLVIDSRVGAAATWSGGGARPVAVSGLEPECTWRAVDVVERGGHSEFVVRAEGRAWGPVRLPLPGQHNVRNCLAALALCAEVGVTAGQACEAIASFPGLHRRFEVLGTWGGVTHVDDYAHHPTAVSSTLVAARAVFPGRRLVAVFQPHQASRTEALFDDFAHALAAAEECHVAPVFTARENLSRAAATEVSARLARGVSERGGRGFLLPNLDPFPATLDHSLQPGDVLIVMGAGDIHRLHHVRTRRFL